MHNDNPQVAEASATLSARMRRGDLFAEKCPSRDVLKHVTSRWGVLILVALLGGTHRFSDLRRKTAGVSERMLAQTLKWLEGDGFVARKAYPVVPPHVEYSLTPLGREVAIKVEALADWIEGNLPQIMAAQVPPEA
ncbi:winged helix-turn-helix transcriptional regulator [Ferribacterium limneticum]|uniref:winged helix-turn-helix transcriptional regulator n=1 Tax=Ferribacterium limneticum TaxID=76259 RepID=UPI001CF8C26A|nr:helix-turn-helix domain-containing protein [Ferribacterium limneticum]UCV22838.1 helix-turn-helix transcriptional regulator [Ferribacterium limneticum]